MNSLISIKFHTDVNMLQVTLTKHSKSSRNHGHADRAVLSMIDTRSSQLNILIICVIIRTFLKMGNSVATDNGHLQEG
jgi:t-SNARE complex subunit (syntaxin)